MESDGQNGTMNDNDPAEALRAVRAVQGKMAARAHWSWPRHLAFGAVFGALVASYALPMAGTIVVLALCLVAAAAIVARDRRRDGFFVNGYRAGRTRKVAAALLATFVLVFAAAIAGRERGLNWAPLAAGFVLFVVATLGSKAWERAYRAELEGKS